MVFSSLTFIYVFLPVVMGLYYLAPKKLKNPVLLLEGIVFYAWGEPIYIIVIMTTTIMDYIYGRLMDRYRGNQKLLRTLIILSVATNIGILAVFKYSSFLIQNMNLLLHTSIPDPHIPLPVGVSFHTFQSMSYTIDMYWGNIAVQKNLVNFCTYVTLYPQMVAGPIVRYNEVEHDIDKRTVNFTTLSEGVTLFVQGLAKKVLLANNIGDVWNTIRAIPPGQLTVASAWFGILCFTFQIYFDFSGYSDMACGLGKMLGFTFPQNFNYPYMSKSVTDFWRRWHITLGAWFRAFVYIPMGGNRRGKLKQLRNILVVWCLTGLWHGASWNYVLWGLYFAFLLILEKFVLKRFLSNLPNLLKMAYSFFFVVIGWVFFEFENLHQLGGYFSVLFGFHSAGLANSQTVYWVYTNALIFIVCCLFSTTIPLKLLQRLKKASGRFVSVMTPVTQVAAMIACTAYLVNSTYNPFLYFRF